MGRHTADREKPCAFDGVLIIDKPVGKTSHTVVNRVRRAAGQRRVGHCGTLDPLASGVLVICLGRATRLSRFAVGMQKTYVGLMRLGVTTDTQDRCGRVLNRRAVTESMRRRLPETAQKFTGPIMQVPPMYSAVKQGGTPLYRLAREGRTVSRDPRPVTIHELRFGDVTRNEVGFRATCSSGTYIRTLCHDMGEQLGCGAIMNELRRVAVGHFDITEATPLDELRERDDVAARIRPYGDIVRGLPSTSVTSTMAAAVANGRPVSAETIEDKCPEGSWIRIEQENGRLLAMGQLRNTEAHDENRCVWPKVVLEERACAS
jgi:tRNA pseudouridine55 synthase